MNTPYYGGMDPPSLDFPLRPGFVVCLYCAGRNWFEQQLSTSFVSGEEVRPVASSPVAFSSGFHTPLAFA